MGEIFVRVLLSSTIYLAALVFNFVPVYASAQEECEGDAPKEHQIGRYHFQSTSRVFRQSNTHFYVTCVANKGEGDLWIDWFVPGPQTYVPSGIAQDSPRPFTTRDTKSYNGCLEYGSHADTITEQFLGHASDQPAIDEEKKLSCDHWARQANLKPEEDAKFEELSYPIRVFFPSDKTSVNDSMLVMQGEVSLYLIGDNRFVSQLEFGVSQFEERDTGSAEEVSVRPIDGGPAGDLVRNIFATALKSQLLDDGRSIPLGWENKIEISATYQDDWVLTSTRYGFYDKNKEFVGAVFVPIIAPLPQ
jgi:hypothetical protein